MIHNIPEKHHIGLTRKSDHLRISIITTNQLDYKPLKSVLFYHPKNEILHQHDKHD